MNNIIRYSILCLGVILCTTSLTSCPEPEPHPEQLLQPVAAAAITAQQQAQLPAGITNTAETKITTITIITPTATAAATLTAATDIN